MEEKNSFGNHMRKMLPTYGLDKIPTLKEKYVKLLADHITVSIEDLTPNELSLITQSFVLFDEKLEDIKILNDENKRISIELANFKAMQDNAKYYSHDDEEDED